jgi:hypothetical protein
MVVRRRPLSIRLDHLLANGTIGVGAFTMRPRDTNFVPAGTKECRTKLCSGQNTKSVEQNFVPAGTFLVS